MNQRHLPSTPNIPPQSPRQSKKSKVHRHSAFFSVQKNLSRTFLNEKSIKVHRRRAQQVNETKKKEMLVFFLTLERRREVLHAPESINYRALHVITSAMHVYAFIYALPQLSECFQYFRAISSSCALHDSAHNFLCEMKKKVCVSRSLFAPIKCVPIFDEILSRSQKNSRRRSR